MTDNFDFKKFLMENKLGAYSKASQLNEREEPVEIEPGVFKDDENNIYGPNADEYKRKRGIPVEKPSSFKKSFNSNSDVDPEQRRKNRQIAKLIDKAEKSFTRYINNYRYAKKGQEKTPTDELEQRIMGMTIYDNMINKKEQDAIKQTVFNIIKAKIDKQKRNSRAAWIAKQQPLKQQTPPSGEEPKAEQ